MQGFLVSRGKYILMVDADGATKFSELWNLMVEMKKLERNGHGIVIGSRAHLEKQAIAKVTLLRARVTFRGRFLEIY